MYVSESASEVYAAKFHSDQVMREVSLLDQGRDGEFDSKKYIDWSRGSVKPKAMRNEAHN